MIEWYRRGPKMRIFVFPPPRAPVTPPPPRVRPGHVNRTSPPAALRNCGAERVFAPPAAKKGPGCPVSQRLKKGYFSTFFRRWGRENALRAAIARCGRRGRPIDVPGAGREAVGAARGRAGAERRKSPFSVPLQPESNCTLAGHESSDSTLQYKILR